MTLQHLVGHENRGRGEARRKYLGNTEKWKHGIYGEAIAVRELILKAGEFTFLSCTGGGRLETAMCHGVVVNGELFSLNGTACRWEELKKITEVSGKALLSRDVAI